MGSPLPSPQPLAARAAAHGGEPAALGLCNGGRPRRLLGTARSSHAADRSRLAPGGAGGTGMARGASGPRPSVGSPVSPDELAEIYRTTYPALVRFLYRKVWDPASAEDLAQEAFARALESQPANVRGWLFVVAANLARDAARRAVRERRHLTLARREPAACAPPADAMADAARERAQVRAALDQLSPRDREVLLLWDAGISYDEIARQTGLARGAVGTTLARARRRLVAAFDAATKGDHVAHG
jgi:RNA polymerase sigma-70 factor, ECF subfamily